MTAQSALPLPTGNQMPVLGLGTWELTHDTAGTVAHALDLGYRMIDTSSDYETQPGIGDAVRRSGLDRHTLHLVTKVEEIDDAYAATRGNLTELDLDYADLMLIHRPPRSGVGRHLWEGLLHTKRDGLTKDIGVSNCGIEQIRELAEATGEMPAVNQIEWTPFGYSQPMLDFCRDHRIVIQAYSPLTRATRLDDATLRQVAGRYGKTPA